MAEEPLSVQDAAEAYLRAAESYLTAERAPQGRNVLVDLGDIINKILARDLPDAYAEVLKRLKVAEDEAKAALFRALMADPPPNTNFGAPLPDGGIRVVQEMASLIERVYDVKVWVITQPKPEQSQHPAGNRPLPPAERREVLG